MPSLHFFSASLLALLQLSSALPAPPAGDCRSGPPGPPPSLPQTGTGIELPTTNHTLVAVTIGRGIQNYTCSAVGAKPVPIGAIATLYDVTPLAYYHDETLLNSIPAKAVYVPASSSGYTLPPPIGQVKPLGHHYFAADGTPTFDLSAINKIIFGKKTGDVKAPASADKGPSGTGAVDWLQLTAKNGSVGLGVVYRIVTAGGAPVANCTSTDLLIEQYAAEYWFYD